MLYSLTLTGAFLPLYAGSDKPSSDTQWRLGNSEGYAVLIPKKPLTVMLCFGIAAAIALLNF